MPTSQFVFCTCQIGAETALKREAAARAAAWRFAFSQPGFLTFKLPEPAPLGRFEAPRLSLARTLGQSIGAVKAEGEPTLQTLAEALWRMEGAAGLLETATGLHVWQRDPSLPGDHGFEPGRTALDREVAQAVIEAAPAGHLLGHGLHVGGVALDVVLLWPSSWWVGCHVAGSRVERWAGGVPAIRVPPDAVSRAYRKMAEALRWAKPPARPGDLWVELGCAPGGASQALLDAGMRVIGIDPAQVDESLADEENFFHLRRRVAETPKKDFVGCRWLAADLNAAPGYTLEAVEEIVTRPESTIRGMLLTLKLPNWDLAAPERLTEYAHRARDWGFRDVRFRQLAHNRQELCMAALKSRGKRRMA